VPIPQNEQARLIQSGIDVTGIGEEDIFSEKYAGIHCIYGRRH
jgi:hypothetical protein